MAELLEHIEDGIATLTFNRPERLNALSTPIMDGLIQGLPRLADDPAVKVVVLTGAGRLLRRRRREEHGRRPRAAWDRRGYRTAAGAHGGRAHPP
jgi:1,4-dihydroxy-2-naphthoyl-CoA synthase